MNFTRNFIIIQKIDELKKKNFHIIINKFLTKIMNNQENYRPSIIVNGFSKQLTNFCQN